MTAQEKDSTILTSSLPGESSSSAKCPINPINTEKTSILMKKEAIVDRKNYDCVTKTKFPLKKTNIDRKTLHQQKTKTDRKQDDRKTLDRKPEATDRRQDDRGGDSAYLLGSRPEADLEMLPGRFQSSPPSSSSSWETVYSTSGHCINLGRGRGAYFHENINF